MISSAIMVVLVNHAHPCGPGLVLPHSRLPAGATSAADMANVGNTAVVSLATELYIFAFLLAWLMSGNPFRYYMVVHDVDCFVVSSSNHVGVH